MTKFGNDVVTYDSRGRISKFGNKSYTYDNYGNRISDGTNTYTWVRGRLLSSVGGASFKYDVNGKRFSKTAGGVTATYYYDEDMLLGENRSDGKKLRYFYDSEGMCGFRYYNGSAWTEYVYVKNAKGDVLAILNGSGTVVANYSYDSWGICTVESQSGGIGDVNPFRYRGYYYDKETSLYYLLTRYYDPTIGQFISPDNFRYLASHIINGVNLYAYCHFNPTINCDPTGETPQLATAAISAVISVGIEFFIDLIEDGKINHSAKDYIGAAISGFIGGFGAGLLSSSVLSGLGDVVGGIITGDVGNFQEAATTFILSAGLGAVGYGIARGRQLTAAKNEYNKIIGQATSSKKINTRLRMAGYKDVDITKQSRDEIISNIADSDKIKKVFDLSSFVFSFASGAMLGISGL